MEFLRKLKFQKWPFFNHGLHKALFLRSQSYDFDAIAHAGAPLGVELLENFMEIV